MEKQVRRKVFFYTLHITKANSQDPIRDKELKDIIEQAFAVDHVPVDEEITIDCIKREENHFFASIGRNKDLATDPLAQKRNPEDRSTSRIEIGTKFEFFTFFLIDYSTRIVTHLFSSNAPAIKRYVCNQIKSVKGFNIDNVYMLTKSVDINSRLKHWHDITEFSYAVPVDSIKPGDLCGFSVMEKLRPNQMAGIKIKLTVKSTEVTDDLKNAIMDYDPAEVEQFSIKGHDDNDQVNNYDVLGQALIQKAEFNLSDDMLKNRETVYKELLEQNGRINYEE